MNTGQGRAPRLRAPLRLGLLCCLAWLALQPFAALPAVAKEPLAPPALSGRFLDHEGQRVLVLWGSAQERGFAQGYLLAERIVAGLSHDLETVMKPFLPQYEALVTKLIVPRFAFSDEERAEMEGLYAGMLARLGTEGLMLKDLGRAATLVDLQALNTFGDWYGLGCSSLAVWGPLSSDGEPLVGRNFDFPGFALLVESQYVVVRAPTATGQGLVGVSYPGSVGVLTGLNAQGRYVAVHDVRIRPGLEKAARANVPRLLAVRRLLEQAEGEDPLADAAALLASWPTLYGNNFFMASPARGLSRARAAVLEYDCRAEIDHGVTRRGPETLTLKEYGDLAVGDECLVCTNHFRARAQPELPPREQLPEAERVCRRYGVLCRAAGEQDGPLSVAAMFAAMSRAAYPLENRPQQRASDLLLGAAKGTLHQAVAETAKGRLHVRLGRFGAHITALEPRVYDVAEWIARARAP